MPSSVRPNQEMFIHSLTEQLKQIKLLLPLEFGSYISKYPAHSRQMRGIVKCKQRNILPAQGLDSGLQKRFIRDFKHGYQDGFRLDISVRGAQQQYSQYSSVSCKIKATIIFSAAPSAPCKHRPIYISCMEEASKFHSY